LPNIRQTNTEVLSQGACTPLVDKIDLAKSLIKLHPFKLTFAACAVFGDESSNSLTKITNRMNDKVKMTEDEADKLITAYKELAQEILSLTHCDKPTVQYDNL
jgi:hypothetical protein